MGSDPSRKRPGVRHRLLSRRTLRRLRPVLWRSRFLLAGLCLAWVVVLLVPALRPAPPAETVLVAERDLPAGAELGAGDLMEVEVTEAPAATPSRESLIGRRLAVGVPAGLPLVETLFVGPGVASGAPPGTVVTPVRLADPALLQLLQVGDRLDLYLAPAAADLGGADRAELVTSGALVLSILENTEAAEGLLDTRSGGDNGVIIVSVDAEDATLLSGASGLASFRAVVVPEA